MAMIGTVTGSFIGPNGNGLENVRMLWVYISEPLDIQQVQFVSLPGDDSPPLPGAKITIVQISESYKIAIAADDKIIPSMLPGERKLYSNTAGLISAFIDILKTGVLEFNGNTDYAVRFNQLQLAITAFVASINLSIDDAIKKHDHPGVTSGSDTSGKGVGTFTPVVADISTSKVLDVKIRGLGEPK